MQLNITEFVDKIKAENVSLEPYEERGIQYLYDKIYPALFYGEEIKISDIDFECFTLEELNTFHDDVCRRASTVDELYSVFNTAKSRSTSHPRTFF